MAYLRSRITLPHSTIHFSYGGLSDGAFVDSMGDSINTVHMGEFAGTEKAWLVGRRGRLVWGGGCGICGEGRECMRGDEDEESWSVARYDGLLPAQIKGR